MNSKLLGLIVVVVAVVFWMRASAEKAPLFDGAFLEYESSGFVTRVTFAESGGDEFTTTLVMVDDAGETMAAAGATGDGATVDARLRTSSGGIFEVASFGPIWIPPGEARMGGRAHGAPIDVVRTSGPWEVAVVSASVGGALRGEWSYDTETGFLVRGSMSTVVSGPGEGQVVTLVGSNIPELRLP